MFVCFICRLMLEYPATGGCVPFAQFRTYKLLRYVTPMDYFVLGCEIIAIFFLIYYTIEEGIEVNKHGLAYIFDIWNILDLVVLSMGYLCVVLNIYRTVSVGKTLTSLLNNTDQYSNFEGIILLQELSDQFLAVFAFVAWIKVQ